MCQVSQIKPDIINLLRKITRKCWLKWKITCEPQKVEMRPNKGCKSEKILMATVRVPTIILPPASSGAQLVGQLIGARGSVKSRVAWKKLFSRIDTKLPPWRRHNHKIGAKPPLLQFSWSHAPQFVENCDNNKTQSSLISMGAPRCLRNHIMAN